MKRRIIVVFLLFILLSILSILTAVSADEKDNLLKINESYSTEAKVRVELHNPEISSGYDDIVFAVWSKVNGQDDVFWYDASYADDVYKADVLLANHSAAGTYYVYCYSYNENGDRKRLAITTFEIAEPGAEAIEIKDTNNNETEFSIQVKNPHVPGGFKDIRIAVWSKDKGQDDLVWYFASKKNSKYSCDVPIIKHKTMGEYIVHVYAKNNADKMIFLGAESFVVDNKPTASINVEYIDRINKKMLVRISDINAPAGVDSVMLPTWCKDDQSDILWYTANADSDGTYTVLVDLKNHKNHTGKYKMHVYIGMKNGIRTGAGANVYYYKNEGSDKIVSKVHESSGISFENSTEPFGYKRVAISDVTVSGGFSYIEYAVYSEKNGRDDILWYVAKKDSKGKYYSDISMNNYDDYGTYMVEAYAVLSDGKKVLIDSSEFKLSKPSVSSVSITNVDVKSGTFRAVIKGIKNPEAAQKLMVNVRCNSDNSKSVWYELSKKNSDGDYYIDINIANNNYQIGKYVVYASFIDLKDNYVHSKYAKVDMNISYRNFTVNDSYDNETYICAVLRDLVVPAGAKEIKFAVWSKENGQDDLIWNTANKQDYMDYYYIPINEHRSLGTYYVHAYAQTKNNKMVFIGSQTFEIKNTASGKVKVSEVNGNKGTFKVTVYDIDAPSGGVGMVQVPVWCSSDQSDIKWYTALEQKDGTYVAEVKVSNHKHHFGTYKVHAYVTMKNGIRNFVDAETVKIKALNYIKLEIKNDSIATLTLLNAGNGYADTVQFPTWSVENGQDDIVWYKAEYIGNNNWQVKINVKQHKSYGDFITHAYVTHDGVRKYVGKINYSMKGKDYSDLLGKFSTTSVNNANGTFNMTKALLSFNGVILQPGETLSFFGVAGPCGYAQGYKVAGTVQGSGYGGGICQASTTLYGAALRSGMTIVERRSHSAKSVYVKVGQDAMVSYGYSDLKFRNDHDRPVKIVTYVIGKTLYAEVWGLQESWYDDVVINSWATGSNTAAAERVFYKDGKVVKREKLTNSYYPKG